MNKLLIATNNRGKVIEIQALLEDLGIQLITPAHIGLQLDVREDGHTYAENASKKAVAFAKASGLISLADDSGLEVNALDGAPGLYSARYGPHLSLPPLFAKHPRKRQKIGGVGGGSDADRRAYLLQNLQNKPRPWRARFHAMIAVATPSGEVHLTEGICEGEIIPEERGTGGFG